MNRSTGRNNSGLVESAFFLLGTEEGKLVKCDLTQDVSDAPVDGYTTCKPQAEIEALGGPVKGLRISPFLHDVILTLDEWSFACKFILHTAFSSVHGSSLWCN